MPTKSQKIHDIAIAFTNAEYKNELERRRDSQNEPIVNVQDRVPAFYATYRDAVETLKNEQQYPHITDD